ncbi:MAG: hypothetical protein R3F58_04320 [Steroidobacteraceae bacterium]
MAFVMPWRLIARLAVAGVLLPPITYLGLLAGQATGSAAIENVAFGLFAVSYPFWLVLWGVMANPDSTPLFAGLIACSLAFNATLYAIVGYLVWWARRRLTNE